jgi:anti-sigma factor RsiW
MACEPWAGKLDAYVDGELPPADERALREHLRGCASCAADSVELLQTKRAVRAAASNRFLPDDGFRARIQKTFAVHRHPRRNFNWLPALAAVAAALLVVVALSFTHNRNPVRERQLMSELADLHVATLASSNPVDVVSSDRHTVKPWFQGKIPFTFNLPELAGSPFVLLGARISYLNQAPGAELIFRVRQHQISVFIFQDRAVGTVLAKERARTELSFNVQSWSRNGLRYFVIGDASADDLEKLGSLLKSST